MTEIQLSYLNLVSYHWSLFKMVPSRKPSHCLTHFDRAEFWEFGRVRQGGVLGGLGPG